MADAVFAAAALASAIAARSRRQGGPHKANRAQRFDAVNHLDPFCRKNPAGPRTCWVQTLASAPDASLSTSTSWPASTDTGLAELRAADAHGVDADSASQHAGVNPGVAHSDTQGRAVARDNSAHRDEVAGGTVRRGRANNLPAAQSSTPPISGHGARTVMKVRPSEAQSELQKA